jgi:hypothetical protein
MEAPETRYAESGGLHIAYQVLGEGARPLGRLRLLSVPQFLVSNSKRLWTQSEKAPIASRPLLEDLSYLHESFVNVVKPPAINVSHRAAFTHSR